MTTAQHARTSFHIHSPSIPSETESRCYYYGLPSRPALIARSSPDIWIAPTGPEAYLEPKELTPLGTHHLKTVWESTVGPLLDSYLQGRGIQNETMVPLRIGLVGESSPPAVIFIGVTPQTLSPTLGLEIAVQCRLILLENGINDVHVELRETKYIWAALMYPPAATDPDAFVDHTARFREPLSTSLGIPICNARGMKGTGCFFFANPAGVPHMVIPRHAAIHSIEENNEHYEDNGGNEPRKNVMILGNATFEEHLSGITDAIDGHLEVLDRLKKRLTKIEMEDENKNEARNAEIHANVKRKMGQEREAIRVFEALLAEVVDDWEEESNRVIGHVIFSPPICFNYGEDGFTDDWAVVEMLPTKISKLNFLGNVIDLGSIDATRFEVWMNATTTNSTFTYPYDGILECHETVSDEKMFCLNKTKHEQDTTIVIKNGATTGVTVGRLNDARSFNRTYSTGLTGMSKEIAVLPRKSSSKPFSRRGDSGSIVVDGMGRFCGMLTGGDTGKMDDKFDITYITSINFLIKRLAACGFEANIFPSPNDLAV